MLQIIIWMMCLYLIVKGVELRLIAASSTHESRDRNMITALIWLVILVVASAFFFWLSLEQGSQMPEPPSFDPRGY